MLKEHVVVSALETLARSERKLDMSCEIATATV